MKALGFACCICSTANQFTSCFHRLPVFLSGDAPQEKGKGYLYCRNKIGPWDLGDWQNIEIYVTIVFENKLVLTMTKAHSKQYEGMCEDKNVLISK